MFPLLGLEAPRHIPALPCFFVVWRKVLSADLPGCLRFKATNPLASAQLGLVKKLNIANEGRELLEVLRVLFEDILDQRLFVAPPGHILPPGKLHAKLVISGALAIRNANYPLEHLAFLVCPSPRRG